VKPVRTVPKLPPRPRDGHKGTFGTVLVVAGSDGMLGASMLAATAALRGGAGLVRVALPAGSSAAFAAAVPCATSFVRSVPAVTRALADAEAVVVGPGLGRGAATTALLRAVLQHATVPVVLDADALFALATMRLPARRAPLVCTPHPGEAARLLGVGAADVQADRSAALRALHAKLGGVVVLKGARTQVGDGVQCFVNTTGNPGMATGGTGDVLAGLLGALLAQGMAPFAAACLAVHVHGRAGDRVAARVSEAGLIASDLPLAIGEELR
jgi:NAD(P)H-hydrate epimerase